MELLTTLVSPVLAAIGLGAILLRLGVDSRPVRDPVRRR